jgi:MFS transporter, DHA1 family, staphyloferrin B biosynthesis exporter
MQTDGLRRNVTLDSVLAVGAGITLAVVGGLLPSIARQAGLVPLGIALLAAAPYLGNLLSALSGRVGPQRIRGFAGLRVTGALLLVAVALAPNPALIVLVVGLFWLAWAFGVPYQSRLWGAMYPADVRGKVIGVLGMAKAAAAGIAALAVGVVADRAGAPLALSLAGGVGACCALGALGLRSTAPLPVRTFSPLEAVRVLTSRPELRRIVLAQGFFGGGQIAAAPLYALVYVDRLNLTLADVGLIAVLTAIATTASYVAWGALVDRRGPMFGLRSAAIFGVLSLALYAVAPDVRLLWVAAIAAGLSNAAIDVGIQGALAVHTPLADRAAAMAGWNAVTGARGVLMPLVATSLVQLHVVDLTTGLVLCLLPAIVGMIMYFDRPLPATIRAAKVGRPAWLSRPAA